MKAVVRCLPLVLLLAVLGLGPAGCTSLSTHTIAYVGVPRQAPTGWQAVAILHEPPAQEHFKLGEVVATTSLNPAPKIEKVETALRQKAARLGADAIVLLSDQIEVGGSWVTGPYWAPTVTPIRSRVVVAVAIKYR